MQCIHPTLRADTQYEHDFCTNSGYVTVIVCKHTNFNGTSHIHGLLRFLLL